MPCIAEETETNNSGNTDTAATTKKPKIYFENLKLLATLEEYFIAISALLITTNNENKKTNP